MLPEQGEPAKAGNSYPYSDLEPEDEMNQLLTDIWHNQATIIKWLSKIAENTKK